MCIRDRGYAEYKPKVDMNHVTVGIKKNVPVVSILEHEEILIREYAAKDLTKLCCMAFNDSLGTGVNSHMRCKCPSKPFFLCPRLIFSASNDMALRTH